MMKVNIDFLEEVAKHRVEMLINGTPNEQIVAESKYRNFFSPQVTLKMIEELRMAREVLSNISKNRGSA